LSLVDVGSPFDPADTHQTMDFGELTTGESLEADLKVLANSGYRVYMESENKGKLKNLSENTTIKYTMYINNRKKSLKGKKSKVAEGRDSTPVEGDNYRLKVQIGNVSGAKAGTYTDNITITAEAK
jgi:spore coat protein U-like protein